MALAVGGCVFICKVCCGSSRVTGTTISSGAAPGKITKLMHYHTVIDEQGSAYVSAKQGDVYTKNKMIACGKVNISTKDDCAKRIYL